LAISHKEAKHEFKKFQKTYHKNYASSEVSSRFQNFQENLNRAEELQKLNPKASFGVTAFSDLSSIEFKQFYLMSNVNFSRDYVAPAAKTEFSEEYADRFGVTPDKTNWDWTNHGVCTPVYNQGQCGSCWAFSATETIESYHVIEGGKLTGLSMEQIVDCDKTDHGCEGGMPSNAYKYVQSAGGIDSLASYPYSAAGGVSGTCKFNKANIVTDVASQSAVDGETGLYKQCSTAGPVSVCVDAASWQSYQGGVLTTCGTDVDHCVQLVGYEKYGQKGSYWIVRNSWGTSWGEKGFIWVEIGKNLCEIGSYATVVKDTK